MHKGLYVIGQDLHTVLSSQIVIRMGTHTCYIQYMQVMRRQQTYPYSHTLRGSVLWFLSAMQLEEE